MKLETLGLAVSMAAAATLLTAGSANAAFCSPVLGCGVAPVPEPDTWAMMLVGFYGLGAVLRSRRAKQASSAV